jgi:hypothetical protein
VEGLGPGKDLEDPDPLGLAGLLGIGFAAARGAAAGALMAGAGASGGGGIINTAGVILGVAPPGNVSKLPSGVRKSFSEQVRGMGTGRVQESVT